MNGVFKKYFSDEKPTRATAGVKFAGDFKIEIEAIAFIPGKNRGAIKIFQGAYIGQHQSFKMNPSPIS